MTKDNLLNKDIKLKTFAIHMNLFLNAKQFASFESEPGVYSFVCCHFARIYLQRRAESRLQSTSRLCHLEGVKESVKEIKNTGTYDKKHV